MKKLCKKCNIGKRTNYSVYCKACAYAIRKTYDPCNKSKLKYTRKHKAKLRLLVSNAKNKPCADCNKCYPSYVMDLDHIKGKKLFHLGSVANTCYSISKVKKEILKCEVVCANCHRTRTFGKKQVDKISNL